MADTLFNKPFALSIGPQRCGVSLLERYFKGRGDVCLPTEVKEIFFFDRHFQRGPRFYADHFAPGPAHKIIMELSSTAFDSPDAPGHVHEMFGDDILLFCPLRHPVHRSLAVYQDYLRYGIVSGDIESAVEQAPQILYSSRYKDHLERWFARFGPGRIKLVFHENLQQDQSAALSQLCAFLSLPFIEPEEALERIKETKRDKRPRFIENFKDVIRHKKELGAGAAPEPPPRDVEWLRKRLADDVLYFEELIGRGVADSDMDAYNG